MRTIVFLGLYQGPPNFPYQSLGSRVKTDLEHLPEST